MTENALASPVNQLASSSVQDKLLNTQFIIFLSNIVRSLFRDRGDRDFHVA